MNNVVHHTEEHGSYKIEIVLDEDPYNPRKEFDQLATMVCFHGLYDLGDKHNFADADEVMEYIDEEHAVYLPLFLYDHGGITMSIGAFSCPWDSGQVGVIFIEREKWQKEYSRKRMSKKLYALLLKMLESEVSIYDAYLTGNVYGCVVTDAAGECVDSCFGYYGTEEHSYMLTEARMKADADWQERWSKAIF